MPKAIKLIPKTFSVNEKTPSNLYNELNKEFNFDFDPCPLNENPAFDGLSISWGKRCFINPPYGKAIKNWLEKALKEIRVGNSDLCVFLLPAYTDVKWFHEIIVPNTGDIRFLKGRLRFSKHKNSAPFASMVVVFSAENNAP